LDYISYDRIMLQYIVGWMMAGILILCVSCACLIYLFKNKEEKNLFVIGLILILVVIPGTFILIGNTVLDSIYDLKNHSYIMVEGEFTIVDDEKTPSRACSIIFPDGTRLDTTVYVIDEGKYSGYVVYAERTKKVLCVNVLE